MRSINVFSTLSRV
jgi:hypothetical protein